MSAHLVLLSHLIFLLIHHMYEKMSWMLLLTCVVLEWGLMVIKSHLIIVTFVVVHQQCVTRRYLGKLLS